MIAKANAPSGSDRLTARLLFFANQGICCSRLFASLVAGARIVSGFLFFGPLLFLLALQDQLVIADHLTDDLLGTSSSLFPQPRHGNLHCNGK